MTLRAEFHRLMAERRAFPTGSPDYAYRTRAACQLVWLMRGVPVNQWPFQRHNQRSAAA